MRARRGSGPKLAFLGANTPLSTHTLHALLQAGAEPEVIVRHGFPETGRHDAGAISLSQPDAFDEVVRRAGLTEARWVRGQRELGDVFAEGWPELAVCACFGERIPAATLERFSIGAINVHPSSLPAYRGPSPLFWQLHDGLAEVGLSCHWMSPVIDAGPVIWQTKTQVEPGVSLAELEARLGQMAGAQLANLLKEGAGPGIGQDSQSASYQSWPTARDYCLSPLWPAERAYRFMRAVAKPGFTFRLQVLAETFGLAVALAYSERDELDQPFLIDGQVIRVRMMPGVLTARLAQLAPQ